MSTLVQVIETLNDLPEKIGSQVATAMKKQLDASFGQGVGSAVGAAASSAMLAAFSQAGIRVGEEAATRVLDPRQAVPGARTAAQIAEYTAALEAANYAYTRHGETAAEAATRVMMLQKASARLGTTSKELIEREKIYGNILAGNAKQYASSTGMLQKLTQASVKLGTAQNDAIGLQNIFIRQYGMSAKAAAANAAEITLLNKQYNLLPGTLERVMIASKDTWLTLGDVGVVKEAAGAIGQFARETGRDAVQISAMVEGFATYPKAIQRFRGLAPLAAIMGGEMGDIRGYIAQRPQTIIENLTGAIGSMQRLAPGAKGPLPTGMSPEVYSQALRAIGATLPELGGAGAMAILQRRPEVRGVPTRIDPMADIVARARRATAPMDVLAATTEALITIRDMAAVTGAGTTMPRAVTMLNKFTGASAKAVGETDNFTEAVKAAKNALTNLVTQLKPITEGAAQQTIKAGADTATPNPAGGV
tara:strand:- start:3122 stop:4552 length:1431 start_codon:yes stop_codon:yes gene_type:complete